jgi:hypothetical protein
MRHVIGQQIHVKKFQYEMDYQPKGTLAIKMSHHLHQTWYCLKVLGEGVTKRKWKIKRTNLITYNRSTQN